MQGSFTGAGSLEAYVELVATLENATMLRDSTVDLVDYDEYRNVIEVNVSTVGVDLTTHVKRTVKNDVSRWILGQPQWQEECSSAAGLTQCRAVTRTTNAFGEVETESTSSNDGIDDTKLTLLYGRDKFGNVKNVGADDAFGHHREATTIYDEQGIFPAKHINALGHETVVEYDVALGAITKLTDPNKLITEWEYDSFGNETLEKRPDGSQTTTTRTREKMNGVWRLKQRTTTTGGDDDETVFDSLAHPVRTYAYGPAPKANSPRIMQVIEYDRLSGNVARKSIPAAEADLSHERSPTDLTPPAPLSNSALLRNAAWRGGSGKLCLAFGSISGVLGGAAPQS